MKKLTREEEILQCIAEITRTPVKSQTPKSKMVKPERGTRTPLHFHLEELEREAVQKKARKIYVDSLKRELVLAQREIKLLKRTIYRLRNKVT